MFDIDVGATVSTSTSRDVLLPSLSLPSSAAGRKQHTMVKGLTEAQPPDIFSLLVVGIFVSALRSDATCGDGSSCLCINDETCFSRVLLEQPCLCENGVNGTWTAILGEIEKNGGEIQSLYISGVGINWLGLLYRSLKSVERNLILRNTHVRDLAGINGLQSVGNLIISANRKLPSMAGLRNLTDIRGASDRVQK